jgi:hypothetical protein
MIVGMDGKLRSFIHGDRYNRLLTLLVRVDKVSHGAAGSG